jgi:hypothetical protein
MEEMYFLYRILPRFLGSTLALSLVLRCLIGERTGTSEPWSDNFMSRAWA